MKVRVFEMVDDNSIKTFPVQIDIASKGELRKAVMMERWNELKKMHQSGTNVVPEATRLLKAMESAGFMNDYLKKMMSDIGE